VINVMMERRDDGEKCTLRFQIPQRQEKTKRKLQFILSVAANSMGFNRGGLQRFC